MRQILHLPDKNVGHDRGLLLGVDLDEGEVFLATKRHGAVEGPNTVVPLDEFAEAIRTLRIVEQT